MHNDSSGSMNIKNLSFNYWPKLMHYKKAYRTVGLRTVGGADAEFDTNLMAVIHLNNIYFILIGHLHFG